MPTHETSQSPNGERSPDPVVRLAEQQNWIAPALEQQAQETIRSAFSAFGSKGEALKSVLHGDWLHEPLHAVLTDVPVGSWTATVLLDSAAALCNSKGMDAGADATLKLGLVGAIASAVAGLADWSEIESSGPRRVGVVHALLNLAGTCLFGASCFLRTRQDRRPNARALAAAGYVVVSLSAHLGGALVYQYGIGVRNNPSEKGTPS